MSYQDKLKPIATSTPSYKTKLKPLAPTQKKTIGALAGDAASTAYNVEKNFATGVSKYGTETVLGLGQLGQKIQRGLTSALGIFGIKPADTEAGRLASGRGGVFDPESQSGAKARDIVKREGVAEHAGATTAEVASYLLPMGLAGNAERNLVHAASRAPSFLRPAAEMAARGFAQGTPAAGVKFIQTGGNAEEAVQTGAGAAIFANAAPLLGNLVKETGKTIHKLATPLSAREAQILQVYRAKTPLMDRIKAILAGNSTTPRTAEETSFAKKLVGTEGMIGVQARRAKDALWKDVISPRLKASPVKTDLNALFKEADDLIRRQSPDLTRQKALLDALDAIKDDYKDLAQVDMQQLQNLKEGWAQFVPEKAYKGQPIAGSVREVSKVLADLARKDIYGALGDDIIPAYIDYGNLRGIAELGQKAMTGAKFKGGSGGFISAIKDMILTPVATIGGLTVYTAGKGIELIGRNGAGVVGDLLND